MCLMLKATVQQWERRFNLERRDEALGWTCVASGFTLSLSRTQQSIKTKQNNNLRKFVCFGNSRHQWDSVSPPPTDVSSMSSSVLLFLTSTLPLSPPLRPQIRHSCEQRLFSSGCDRRSPAGSSFCITGRSRGSGRRRAETDARRDGPTSWPSARSHVCSYSCCFLLQTHPRAFAGVPGDDGGMDGGKKFI